MQIYAIIKDDVIVTSSTEQEGYTGFTVNVVGQLYVTAPDIPDGEEYAPSITIMPYNVYKEGVLKQIENVYNYIISSPMYTIGTKANSMLEKARASAVMNIHYLTPPTTTALEETEYIYALAVEAKLIEIKAAKKLEQNAPVVSPIDGVDKTFFGGVESITKYSGAMDLSLALNQPFREILTLEGLVNITKTELDIAIIKMSIIIDNAWRKEVGLIQTIMKSSTLAELEDISW